MTYQNMRIDAIVAKAIGDDPQLAHELGQAYLKSAQSYLDIMTDAETQPEWRDAAFRLKGLSATFGVDDVTELASRAAVCPYRDMEIVSAIMALLNDLSRVRDRIDS